MMSLVLGATVVIQTIVVVLLLSRMSVIGVAYSDAENEVAKLAKQAIAQSQVLCDRNIDIRRKDERIELLLQREKAASDALIKARGFINQAATEIDPPF